MARWEPGAKLRLVDAAVDLFLEQGYENTSVAEIAERAGLAKSSFFRHFPDKREVLLAGQDILSQLLAEGIATAPPEATPMEAVAAGVAACGEVFVPERRAFAVKLRSAVASNPELQEREALKRARFTEAMTDALRQRGVDTPLATVAAELGALAFRIAWGRWADAPDDQKFEEITRATVAELQTASMALR
jgi:AcrR family transcriptional regulator